MDVEVAANATTVALDDEAEASVTLRAFNKADFTCRAIIVSKDKIDQVTHPLRDISPDHDGSVKQSFCNNGLDYTRSLVTITQPNTFSAFDIFDGMPVLRQDVR